MYNIELSKKCGNDLSRLVKEKSISKDELIVIRTWLREMKNFGPDYISSCGYWDDHSLGKDREGQRASSFSISERIIYKVLKKKINVKVIRITADHNYKK